MAKFIPNRFSSASIAHQYQVHLQQQQYTGDLTAAIATSIDAYNTQADRTREVLVEAAAETTQAVDQLAEITAEAALAQIRTARQNAALIVGAVDGGTTRIIKSIDSAGHLLSNATTQVANQIGALATSLDFGLSRIQDQFRIGNMLTQNIAMLLRVPDFQKERIYYMEQGFKHYRNATIDQSLFGEALENLLKAEEKEKSDYIVLHRIGMIYLHSADFLDPPKAETYFSRAARLAAVESEPSATRVAQILTGDMSSALESQAPSAESVARLAADSLLQAAFCRYLASDYRGALDYSSRAMSLHQSALAPKFAVSKYLALSGQPTEAVAILERVISADRYYAIAVADDPDLSAQPEVVSLLSNLREAAYHKLAALLSFIESAHHRVSEDGPLAKPISSIRELQARNTYLDLLEGLDAATRIEALLKEEASRLAQAKTEFRAALRSIQESDSPFILEGGTLHQNFIRLKAVADAAIDDRHIAQARHVSQQIHLLKRETDDALQALDVQPSGEPAGVLAEVKEKIRAQRSIKSLRQDLDELFHEQEITPSPIATYSFSTALHPVVTYSPDGHYILARDMWSFLIIDSLTGNIFTKIDSDGALYYDLHMSQDNGLLVAVGHQTDEQVRIRVMDVGSGKLLTEITLPPRFDLLTSQSCFVSFTPKADQILTCRATARNGSIGRGPFIVETWNVRSGQIVDSKSIDMGSIRIVSSPIPGVVAIVSRPEPGISSDDYWFGIYESATGKLVRRFSFGLYRPDLEVAFSPDGEVVAGTGYAYGPESSVRKCVRLWAVSSGELLGEYVMDDKWLRLKVLPNRSVLMQFESGASTSRIWALGAYSAKDIPPLMGTLSPEGDYLTYAYKQSIEIQWLSKSYHRPRPQQFLQLRKLREEGKRANTDRLNRANVTFAAALAEIEKQDRKRFLKSYRHAEALFVEADALGHPAAKEMLDRLRNR